MAARSVCGIQSASFWIGCQLLLPVQTEKMLYVCRLIVMSIWITLIYL